MPPLGFHVAKCVTVALLGASLVACATTQSGGKASATAPAEEEVGLRLPDADLPNGITESCEVLERHADVGGDKRMIAIAGGTGAFFLVLPEATDWKLQCNRERYFWASSESRRMQVSVNPYEPEVGEDLSPRNFLAALGAKMKVRIASTGARVTHESIVPLFNPTDNQTEIFGREATIAAPQDGQTYPLLPQDSYHTVRHGPGGYLLVAHVTTYYRNPAEQEALRSVARTVMGAGFRTSAELQGPAKRVAVQDFTRPSRLPSFPGVATTTFSDKTLVAIKAVLDCQADTIAVYCNALDRFGKAKAMPKNASGVWAGSTLAAFAGEGGKIATLGVGGHHLYVKKQRASFNMVKPSNPSEASDLRSALEQIRGGHAPSPESGLMKYLSSFTPMQTTPVEIKGGSLSFIMGIGANLAVKEDQLPKILRDAPRVFARETANEILVVEIWGDGLAVKVGIFVKS
jgi:hypothetical protein